MVVTKLKIFIFITFFLLQVGNIAYAQYWELIPGSPTSVYTMTCDAKGNLWAGTNGSNVYLYDGNDWKSKGRVSQSIRSIAVAPNGNIYVGGSNGGLYMSTNGETIWNNVFNAGIINMIGDIVISNSGGVYLGTSGIYAGRYSDIFMPYNGSWRRTNTNGISGTISSPLALAPNGTLYAKESAMEMLSIRRYIVRSTDDGNSWQRSTSSLADVHNIAIVDNNTIFLAAYSNGILKSTDAGQSWARCDPTIDGRTNRVSYGIIYNSKTKELFAHIDDYREDCRFLRSTNLGENWELVESGLPYIGSSYTYNVFAFNPITGETYLIVGSDAERVYRSVLKSSVELTIEIDPANINFHNVIVGDSLQRTVRIKNNGSIPLVISQVSKTGDAVFTLPNGETTIKIEPWDSYNLTVQFSPTAAIIYTGTITLTHDASGGSSTIRFGGKGIFNAMVGIKRDYKVKSNEMVKISVDAINDLTGRYVRDFSFKLKYNKRILSFKDVTLSGTLSNSLNCSTEGSTYGELNVKVTNSAGTLLSGTGKLIDINFFGLGGDSCGTHLILESFEFNSDGLNVIAENGYCELFGRCGGEWIYVTSEQNPLLFQNNPNPIRAGYEATIQYKINVAGETSLIVYDILGREVTKLVNEYKSEGMYSVNFNTKGLPSGVYFYKLRAPGYEGFKKMLVIK